MQITQDNLDQLAWNKMDQLLPCVVQDASSQQNLMLGYMNPAALEESLSSGLVTFYSRSKARLWTKGESSGNHLKLVSISADCDQDALLVQAIPQGTTCHLGTTSCWPNNQATTPNKLAFLQQLETLLAERKQANADSSYTASLYAKGIKRIAQKVGEEGVETALAAATGDIEELKNESADLIYHLLVLLQANNLQLSDVLAILQARHQ